MSWHINTHPYICSQLFMALYHSLIKCTLLIITFKALYFQPQLVLLHFENLYPSKKILLLITCNLILPCFFLMSTGYIQPHLLSIWYFYGPLQLKNFQEDLFDLCFKAWLKWSPFLQSSLFWILQVKNNLSNFWIVCTLYHSWVVLLLQLCPLFYLFY